MSEVNHCHVCKMCCKTMGVDETNKPKDTWCEHVCSTGCSIYPDRPKGCREFKCWWLFSQETELPMKESMRPDNSRVIIDSRDGNLVFHCNIGFPNAWKHKDFLPIIDRAIKAGKEVLVIHGSNRILLDAEPRTW